MKSFGSAAKRHRQSEVRRVRNKSVRSEIKSSIRKFTEAVSASKADEALSAYKTVQKLLDTATRKGVYHANTAARKKSRLSARLNALNA